MIISVMEDFIFLFSEGLTFTGGTLTQRKKGPKQGYYHDSPEPKLCLFCTHSVPHFHRHGYYPRSFKTLRNSVLMDVLLYNLRWLCMYCGHTISFLPDDLFPYKRFCSLSLLLLLWLYLHHQSGYYDKDTQHIPLIADERTIVRYVQSAKKVAIYTQQFIREVIIDIGEPRPLELVFKSGLSPPETLMKRHRGDSQLISMLWQTAAMLLTSCKKHHITPSKLLARAHKNAKERHRPFLI